MCESEFVVLSACQIEGRTCGAENKKKLGFATSQNCLRVGTDWSRKKEKVTTTTTTQVSGKQLDWHNKNKIMKQNTFSFFFFVVRHIFDSTWQNNTERVRGIKIKPPSVSADLPHHIKPYKFSWKPLLSPSPSHSLFSKLPGLRLLCTAKR